MSISHLVDYYVNVFKLSACPCVCLSVGLSVDPAVGQLVCKSIGLAECPSIGLSVCPTHTQLT